MKQTIFLTCCLVVLPAAALAATADGETVKIGGVTIPADCPLARKEHPRLLFTQADLPRLRARLKHPRIATELQRAEKMAADGKLKPDGKLLEIGCAYGFFLDLARKHWDVRGLDVAEEGVAHARDDLGLANVEVADFLALPDNGASIPPDTPRHDITVACGARPPSRISSHPISLRSCSSRNRSIRRMNQL